MTQYKGCYIDHVIFNSKADIDRFLKEKAVEAYKIAVEIFAFRRNMESSIYMMEKAEVLVGQYGYTWDQVEEIEIEVYKNIA